MVVHSRLGYHTIRISNEAIEKQLSKAVSEIIGLGCFLQKTEKAIEIYETEYSNFIYPQFLAEDDILN
ncbi:hypothetical protein MUG87_14605 [Ectobacillus sp. JY-23]|uniref:hypothetical protein n=1 Tax=Ectobacillus sp. JY-23 TaxID=2933872 RepID=UPI001FF2618F|nr:hypothetical protein [Ectobacillus sp. JY-23]UOY91714.1 hypothetical protein MUG87_14605 [Ectobacillus sp. JY-23]